MLEVKAFRGYRFASEKTDNLDDNVTPPFDVISPAQRAALAARSPHNMVHLILPEAEGGRDPYQQAAHLLENWTADGVLQKDEEESFYLLEQSFTSRDGVQRVRRGFFAVAKIPEEGENTVLGHEKTFPGKIEDRLALTRATGANLGAVFVIYADPEHKLQAFLDQMKSCTPDVTAHTIDGVTQRLWKVPADPAVTAFFRGEKLYIADGHHRFATACANRDARRAQQGPESGPASPRPYDYIFLGFVAFEDPGLLVYAAHRVLDPPQGFSFPAFRKKLQAHFHVDSLDGSLAEALEAESGVAIGLALRGEGQFLLRLREGVDRAEFLGDDHGPAWRDLDVALLHRGILEKTLGMPPASEFIYDPDPEAALARCENGEKGMVFLLKNPTPHHIKACADAGEFMPQKATYLFPKLPTGAVFYRFE